MAIGRGPSELGATEPGTGGVGTVKLFRFNPKIKQNKRKIATQFDHDKRASSRNT